MKRFHQGVSKLWLENMQKWVHYDFFLNFKMKHTKEIRISSTIPNMKRFHQGVSKVWLKIYKNVRKYAKMGLKFANSEIFQNFKNTHINLTTGPSTIPNMKRIHPAVPEI